MGNLDRHNLESKDIDDEQMWVKDIRHISNQKETSIRRFKQNLNSFLENKLNFKGKNKVDITDS